MHASIPLITFVAAALSTCPVQARTPAEEAMAAAPMAHESAPAGGARVVAHYVRLDGYQTGMPDDAARLAQLKATAAACVQMHRASGRPVNPSAVWPEHTISIRQDTYATAVSTVIYNWSIAYGIDVTDCSLMETKTVRADMTWRGGSCRVDYTAGTASRGCDAIPELSPPPAPARRAGVSSRPAPASGARKNILGLECQVQRTPLIEGTVCMSLGGTFDAAHARGSGQSGMTLEMETTIGPRMHAVAAKLDADISARVFQPHLALRPADGRGDR